ncbi:MAG TPA: HDIG domain-containing protein, partial [Candidatus Acetothermia bacterium]|nr:HDIG domain-containing protein [Candidatus Acetothermia bacterium]
MRKTSGKKKTKTDPSPFPWPELLALSTGALLASSWQWEVGRIQLASLPQLVGGMVSLVGGGVLAGWRLPPSERRLGLVLLTVGALLSRLASGLSPFFTFLPAVGGLAVMFWPLGKALLLLLPLGAWLGAMSGAGPAGVGLLSGLAMAVWAQRIRQGQSLFLAGVGAGLVGGLAALPSFPEGGWWGVGMASLSSPASALLAWLALPGVERLVDRTSPLSLVGLLNPAHPLLARLREQAPGTYYHSRDVAALAEAGARAVGADPLLATVGGLYHDIGKLARPQFFAENQHGENPHRQLAPSMSKVVLAAHLREGVELGRRYGLRGDVLKFVATHHGTSVMRYFSQQGASQGLA